MANPTWYEYVIDRLNQQDARIKHLEKQIAILGRHEMPTREESPWAPDWNPPPQPGA